MNNYLSLYKNYFWQWEDGAQVIAIPDGSTIVYRQLMGEILTELYPDGIPPFGSILLALAVLHPQGKENSDQIFQITRQLDDPEINTEKYSDEAFGFLRMLETMPAKYKTGDLKKYVIRALFRDAHNSISLKKSQGISSDFDSFQHNYNPAKLSQSAFDKDFRVIALLSREFDSVNSIIDKINTLPDLEENLNLEEIDKEGPKDFIDELIMNPGTHKVGALVKVLWSGLNLPVKSSQPSQMPMGGVSDLTNKGQLPQLLISEFANDDLIFLSRLANNEALYLNRESPPTENDMRRVILIDVSLKNWGTAKTIAFATMLAIAKHPKTTIDCDVFVVGETFQKVVYNTVEGIMKALQIVDASLEPSKGLQNYFDIFPANKNQEVFVLTERTTKNNPNMLKTMHDLGADISYWIYNDAQGHIDVYKKLKTSSKHLQHLELPYEQLWQKQGSKKPKRKKEEQADESFYPILFRPIERDRAVAVVDGMVFLLTKSKALFRLSSSSVKHHEKGWEFIMKDLPFYDPNFKVGCLSNGEYLMLLYNMTSNKIAIVNLNTNEVIIKTGKSFGATRDKFSFINDKFYHLHGDKQFSIDQFGEMEKILSIRSETISEEYKELMEYHSKQSNRHNMLKWITKLGISEKGNLTCNTSQLHKAFGEHLKLEVFADAPMMIMAESSEEGIFIFPDGSIVRNTFLGMIELISSDKSIPIIYVPTALNASLGAATLDSFSGNSYYYNQPLYDVVLEDAGPSKLQIVKIIRESTALGLKEIKELVDDPPKRIPFLLGTEEADEILKSLSEFEGKAHKKALMANFTEKPEIIPMYKFYTTYIQAFVDVIKTHHGVKA
ncbi:MAG: hypothetical protein GQ574_04525 [Crocinitomix sp.]|nr:hypothetical protein [Crocinitomix sp.]